MPKCRFSFAFLLWICASCLQMPESVRVPTALPDEERAVEAWSLFYQGLQDEESGLWASAAVNFDKSAALSPGEPRIYCHLAWCLLHCGMSREASEAVERARGCADPRDYMMHFDLGNVYRALGEVGKSEDCYLRCLEIFPGFHAGRRALADLKGKPETD